MNTDTEPSPPPVPEPDQQPDGIDDARQMLLSIAHAELGNADPKKYWLDVQGVDPGKKYAWCAVFYLWCLRQSGLCDWHWPLYFSQKLRVTKYPQPGDLAYFDHPYQHHAMVQRVNGIDVHLIQGNFGLPGHVAESVCLKVKPVYYSIESLL